jgi:hypothetical protein
MADEAAKRAWIGRVLGVTAGSADAPHGPLLPLWLDAKDEVDAKLGHLQGSLRGFGDPDLDRIAEFGLNGVTGTSSVGLMVALREADAPGADAAARRKLAGAIDSYRAFLDGSEVVKLIDDNPFGVAVGLQATLGRALDTLASSLGT